MNLEKMTEQDLRNLIRQIISEVTSAEKPTKQKLSSKHYSKQGGSDIENLIGSIPFILLDKTIFQKNMDVVEFAAKIGIPISSGEKKKLSEIVGRIIEAITEFRPDKIAQLNAAISQLKSSSTNRKKDKISFFEEWDRVIKNIKM